MDGELKPLAACLADIGNDDGEGIHPSIAYLSWLLDWSERSIQRGMRKLRLLGALVPLENAKGGRGLRTIYRLDVDKLPSRPKWKKGVASDGVLEKGDTCDISERVTPEAEKRVTDSAKSPSERVTDSTERVTPVTGKGDTGGSCNKEEPLVNREIYPLGEAKTPPDLHPLNYAVRLLQDLGVPETRSNSTIVAAAVSSLVRGGKELAAAYEFLLAKALNARDEGVLIDKFWFEDGKYNYAGTMQKLSAAQQRQQGTRENLTAALRDRYGSDATVHDGNSAPDSKTCPFELCDGSGFYADQSARNSGGPLKWVECECRKAAQSSSSGAPSLAAS